MSVLIKIPALFAKTSEIDHGQGHDRSLTILDFLADNWPRGLPKQLQVFTWLRFREIDFDYPRVGLVDIPVLLADISFFLGVAKCNEFPGMDSNRIQPFKLFFIAKKGL